MNYYIDLFSPKTAKAFGESDMLISGFRPSQETYVKNKKIKKGDKLICYITEIQRFIGILEVQGGYYFDNKPIFNKVSDPFTLRFQVKTLVWLPLELSVPIHDDKIWGKLSFTKMHEKNSNQWTHKVFASPRIWDKNDGKMLETVLLGQSKKKELYKLSEKDKKILTNVSLDTEKTDNYGKNFQNKVAIMLKESGFMVVQNELHKPGYDILIEDPYTDTRFVIQCKTTEKKNAPYPNLMSLIDEYATIARESKATKAILILNKYRLSNKIKLENLDQKLKSKKISLWTGGVVKNYIELAKSIGAYAKYQILSDLGISARFGDDIMVPAFMVYQNYETEKNGQENPKINFMVARLKPEWLIKSSTVHRRVDKGGYMTGYQRVLEKSRIFQLGSYLSKEEWALPNSIILCTNTSAYKKNRFEVNKDGLIKLQSITGSFWVMDGQHRLYGFAKSEDEKDMKSDLICVIFDSNNMGSNYEERQANIFVDINYKSKKVSTSLLLELMQDYNLLNIKDNIGVDIVKKIAKEPEFKNLISGYSDKSGLINLTTFVSSIKALCGPKGAMAKYLNTSDYNQILEKGYKIILSFFKNIKIKYQDEWANPEYSLSSDKGIRGLFILLGKTLENTNNINEKIMEIIIALKKSEFDFHKHNFKGKYTGGQGAKELSEVLSAHIGYYAPGFPHDSQYLGKIPTEESEYVEFKSSLRWNIKAKMITKDLEFSVVKTICAFMNSKGGKLYIGVNDNHEVVGLEEDFATFKNGNGSKDDLELHLRGLVDDKIGSIAVDKVHYDFQRESNKFYCIVSVESSRELVYFEDEIVFVREGNRTMPYTGKKIEELIHRRNKGLNTARGD